MYQKCVSRRMESNRNEVHNTAAVVCVCVVLSRVRVRLVSEERMQKGGQGLWTTDPLRL